MRVFIDPGHGGVDPGATFRDLQEKDLVLQIALRIADRVKAQGHHCEMSRRTDFFVNLARRAREANDWLADVFLSVHLNADPDPDEPGFSEASGYEFWIYPGSKGGRHLAEEIDLQVMKQFPEHPPRGIKEATFMVLKSTKMPAVLLELAFIDTMDSNRLTRPDVQERLAMAVADGVQGYFDTGEGMG